MKILTLWMILVSLVFAVMAMPSSDLPAAMVEGTQKIEGRGELELPPELSHMTRKEYYLKTGKILNNRINRRHQRNFWGKGVEARVRYPVHLAMWEEARVARAAIN
ncbi:MAG: hypothetical protein GF392_02965 [Candidatus Omnitrophica bacterium]|nr:hypothetical protein [Candidatus Omnitrophota bacterium]